MYIIDLSTNTTSIISSSKSVISPLTTNSASVLKKISTFTPGTKPFCLAYPFLSSRLNKCIPVIDFLSNTPEEPIVKDTAKASKSSIDINLIL